MRINLTAFLRDITRTLSFLITGVNDSTSVYRSTDRTRNYKKHTVRVKLHGQYVNILHLTVKQQSTTSAATFGRWWVNKSVAI